MNICKNCGQEFETGNFCPNCGTEVVLEQPEFVQPEFAYEEPAQEVSDPGKAKGIVALVMGILSLVNSCSCGMGIVFAIIGMILGSSGVKSSLEAGFENKMGKIGKTLSIIGLITGIIGFVCVVIYYIFCIIIGMSNY